LLNKAISLFHQSIQDTKESEENPTSEVKF